MFCTLVIERAHLFTHLVKCLFMVGYPPVFQIFDNELKDQEREVCFVDIAYDEIPERYYKESEVHSK